MLQFDPAKLNRSNSVGSARWGSYLAQSEHLKIKIPCSGIFRVIVRWRGLEPPRLAAHGPQPCLSANSSTSAHRLPHKLPNFLAKSRTWPLISVQQIMRYFASTAYYNLLALLVKQRNLFGEKT